MVSLSPCRTCHRAPECEIKKRTAAALRGLSITKASLRCQIPQADFPLGTVVDVKAFELIPGDYGSEEWAKSAIVRRGVVRAWYDAKATVVLFKDHEIEQPHGGPIGYLKVSPNRMSLAGLPAVALCACGLPQERCDAGDYPSIRNGSFACPAEIVREYA